MLIFFIELFDHLIFKMIDIEAAFDFFLLLDILVKPGVKQNISNHHSNTFVSHNSPRIECLLGHIVFLSVYKFNGFFGSTPS